MKHRVLSTILTGCLALASAYALAQAPAQTNMIVPYPAGGGSDFIARTLAPSLSKSLGQNIIVENVGGAGGAIGSQRILQHPNDGHTLLLGSPNEVMLAPAVNKAITYKAEDFRLIGPATETSLVLVGRPSLKAADIKELLQQAQGPNATPITYGSVGIGSLYHVVGEVLTTDAKANLTHVPYRGMAPLVTDLMGGVIDIAFLPLAGNVLGLIKDGKIKTFGIAQARRNHLVPDIPTLGEIDPQLKNFIYPTWAGILVRGNTPDAEVVRLQAALAKALTDPKVKQSIEATGSEVAKPMNLEQANAFYKEQTELFRKIVNDHKIQVN